MAHIQSLRGLAELKREQGELRQSQKLLTMAIDDLEDYAERRGNGRRHGVFLGPLYMSLARTLSALGESDSAREATLKARTWFPVSGPASRPRIGRGPGRHRPRPAEHPGKRQDTPTR